MTRLTAEELAERHPGVRELLEFFEHAHLPADLQAVSEPVGDLAHEMVAMLPDGPELTTGLRKLLEAKDCLVRQQIVARKTSITRERGAWVAPNARGGEIVRGPAPDAMPRCSATRDGEQCVIGDQGAGHAGDHLFPSDVSGPLAATVLADPDLDPEVRRTIVGDGGFPVIRR